MDIEQEIIKGGDYNVGMNGVAIINNTFNTDFQIAEMFGVEHIKDTYKRAFNEWKHDIKYMTVLSLALNHRCWAWYEKNDEISRLYEKLWREIDNYILDYDEDKEEDDPDFYRHYNHDEISYYVRAVD